MLELACRLLRRLQLLHLVIVARLRQQLQLQQFIAIRVIFQPVMSCCDTPRELILERNKPRMVEATNGDDSVLYHLRHQHLQRLVEVIKRRKQFISRIDNATLRTRVLSQYFLHVFFSFACVFFTNRRVQFAFRKRIHSTRHLRLNQCRLTHMTCEAARRREQVRISALLLS